MMMKEDPKDEAEQILSHIHKKLTDAFDVFDGDKTRTVDLKEIATIVYSLNLVPTLGELHDLVTEMEDEDNSDVIRFEKFLSVMTDVLINKRFRPSNENQIFQAFQALDVEKKGFLTKDDLIKYMTTEGEVLNSEEMNEMLQNCLACADPNSSSENPHILYKYFVSELAIEETGKE